VMFQGKNEVTLAGAFPPASVQLSKYHLSHRRGLIPHIGSVAKSVNIIAAKGRSIWKPNRSSS
jgi:hypothetical protein